MLVRIVCAGVALSLAACGGQTSQPAQGGPDATSETGSPGGSSGAPGSSGSSTSSGSAGPGSSGSSGASGSSGSPGNPGSSGSSGGSASSSGSGGGSSGGGCAFNGCSPGTLDFSVDGTVCQPQLQTESTCMYYYPCDASVTVCGYSVEVPCGADLDAGPEQCSAWCAAGAPSGLSPLPALDCGRMTTDAGTAMVVVCGGCGI